MSNLIREVGISEANNYNQVVNHPLQSWQWGEFRQKRNAQVVRLGEYQDGRLVSGLQVSFHSIPKLPFTIGYLPRSIMPNQQMLTALKDLGHKYKALFIKMEPNKYYPLSQAASQRKLSQYFIDNGCIYGKPQFTKYSFMLDLRLSEQDLLAKMKSKTRYNIGLAIRKGVEVVEDNSDTAFEEYLRLTFEETTVRQKFYAHDREYHRQMWQYMREANIAHLLTTKYQGKILVTWILFSFNGVLYYPYGASSSQNRNVMASSLMMWEAIKLGKSLNNYIFDMWGALPPDAPKNHPWQGFHRFKEGFGPTLMEFVGTYDLVLDMPKYQLYQMADKLRWKWLKFRAALPF